MQQLNENKRQKLFIWNEKENVLYISLLMIMPDMDKLSREEWIEHIKDYHKTTLEERINTSELKEEIEKEIAKHPGCKIKQYIDRN